MYGYGIHYYEVQMVLRRYLQLEDEDELGWCQVTEETLVAAFSVIVKTLRTFV